jgi:1-acyl-sn-glycerol-3-phosphate acyltransferase
VVYVLRYALIVIYTILWGVPASLIGPFDKSGRVICWIGRNWIRWILRTCGVRVVAEGLENVSLDRAQVLMNNHQSVFDVGALVATLPVDFRFVAKKELGYIPLFGWALASSVGIMIDRASNTKSVASLRAAAQRIREGANVIIFPEGTRSPSGVLQPFKSGGFHLAIQAQVPIVPVTISGSQAITPKGSLRVESGVVKIVYGKPIPTEGLGPDDRNDLKACVREAILSGFDPDLQPDDVIRAGRALGHVERSVPIG